MTSSLGTMIISTRLFDKILTPLKQRQRTAVSCIYITMLHHILLVLVLFGEICRQRAAVDARGPPTVTRYERRHRVLVGDPLRLVCPIVSDPPSLVEWKKDGEIIHDGWERIRTHDNQLRIRETSLTDRGTYSCIATNGFGTINVSIVVYVTTLGFNSTDDYEHDNDDAVSEKDLDDEQSLKQDVQVDHDRSKPTFLEPYPEGMTVRVGGVARFVCRVSGSCVAAASSSDENDEQTMEWLKLLNGSSNAARMAQHIHDAVNLTLPFHRPDSSLQIRRGVAVSRSRTDDGVTYTSSLTLHDVRERDAGLYVCACSATGHVRGAFLFVARDERLMSIADTNTDDIVSPTSIVAPALIILSLLLVATVIFVIRCRRLRRSHPSKKISCTPLPYSAVCAGDVPLGPGFFRSRPPSNPGYRDNRLPYLSRTSSAESHERRYLELQQTGQGQLGQCHSHMGLEPGGVKTQSQSLSPQLNGTSFRGFPYSPGGALPYPSVQYTPSSRRGSLDGRDCRPFGNQEIIMGRNPQWCASEFPRAAANYYHDSVGWRPPPVSPLCKDVTNYDTPYFRPLANQNSPIGRTLANHSSPRSGRTANENSQRTDIRNIWPSPNNAERLTNKNSVISSPSMPRSGVSRPLLLIPED